MDLIGVVIVLILIGFLLWVVAQLPLDPYLVRIIRAVVLLVVILWLINLFLGPIHIPIRR